MSQDKLRDVIRKLVIEVLEEAKENASVDIKGPRKLFNDDDANEQLSNLVKKYGANHSDDRGNLSTVKSTYSFSSLSDANKFAKEIKRSFKGFSATVFKLNENSEEEIEENSATGNVSGYNVPGAFSGDPKTRGKKKRGQHGGKAATGEGGCPRPDVLGYTIVEEYNPPDKRQVKNRWLDLKQDESKTPVQKIGIGVRRLNRELKEVESFVRWYKRLQIENDLESDQHWKRTQSHIKRMKERIVRIAKDIMEMG